MSEENTPTHEAQSDTQTEPTEEQKQLFMQKMQMKAQQEALLKHQIVQSASTILAGIFSNTTSSVGGINSDPTKNLAIRNKRLEKVGVAVDTAITLISYVNGLDLDKDVKKMGQEKK
jgi:hypothetical protein